MKLITFPLAGPLQSWGEQSRWDYRDTSAMPTKSAVIGLLGCCLGWKRGDERLTDLSRRIHLAVRAERSGRAMTDFHTVQGPGGVILNSENKPRGSTIITPRQYLQDAYFQVFLFGEEEALQACLAALRHPQWPVCLGRRSCPPAYPVIPQEISYPTVEEALRQYRDTRLEAARTGRAHGTRMPSKRRAGMIPCQIELLPGETADHVLTRQDEPVRADRNEYATRRVRMLAVKGEGGEYVS